ncbi:MAG: hypothetical protein RIS76_3600, partial [Verrucomicrobiota bacterium]
IDVENHPRHTANVGMGGRGALEAKADSR